MPFYAYILISSKSGNYYFGHCQNLSIRLSQHNSGKVKSTKNRRPWFLHYNEEFHTKSEAYKREQFFKSLDGRKWLYEKEILKRTD
jgi:putative endonuclease